MSTKVKKGDNVFVLHGKDRGKRGKVVKVFPASGKILVEGVNERVRHVRPRRAGEKGQSVHVLHPIWGASVAVLCPSCGKRTRVGYRVDGDTKVRVCKKCKADIS